MAKESDHLKPVLSADTRTFCSPACGMGCTTAAHARSTLNAAKLAKRMGPGWEPVVWENLGWHYKVHHTPSDTFIYTRSDEGSEQYTVYTSRSNPQVVTRSADPVAAFDSACEAVDAHANRQQAVHYAMRRAVE